MVSVLLILGVALAIWTEHPSPLSKSQAATPEHESSLTVQGQVFRIKTPDQVTAKEILVAAGPQGFYWSLPQNPGSTRMGYLDEPAVIHYTPYTQREVIDPATARLIYSLPLQDICNTGAWTGSLHLDKIVLQGKWLFYFYGSEMRDAAQTSYVALGAVDTSSPYPEDTLRFLYRGADEGGGFLEWAVSSDFVVWQQGWTNPYGGIDVTTSLYDLDTGLQQALPLPAGEMAQFIFTGNNLEYRDEDSQGPCTTLPLPPPGSARLVPGARWLPAVVFGEAAPVCRQFPGTVYLPAVVNPAPFYQVTVDADTTHYEVDFNANEHPVPLNATDQEGRELGGGPVCADLLGSIAGYGGSPPQAAKELLAEDLPRGQLFKIQVGKRTLTGPLPELCFQPGDRLVAGGLLALPAGHRSDLARPYR